MYHQLIRITNRRVMYQIHYWLEILHFQSIYDILLVDDTVSVNWWYIREVWHADEYGYRYEYVITFCALCDVKWFYKWFHTRMQRISAVIRVSKKNGYRLCRFYCWFLCLLDKLLTILLFGVIIHKCRLKFVECARKDKRKDGMKVSIHAVSGDCRN